MLLNKNILEEFCLLQTNECSVTCVRFVSESESESEQSGSEEEKRSGSSRQQKVRQKSRVTRSHRTKQRKKGA